MPSIYSYTDYRSFLRDALAEKRARNRGFSLRAVARRLGVGSGTLSRILSGSRQLGSSLLQRFTEFLGLRAGEAHYFELLVHYERTRDDASRRAILQELLQLRSARCKAVPLGRYRLFEQWYHVALHQLVRLVPDEGDPARLSALLDPPVSAAKTRKALNVLLGLGLIRHNAQGGYDAVDPTMTVPENWRDTAVQSFQVDMAALGRRAIDHIDPAARDVSTLTVDLSGEAFARVREVLARARREILAIEKADNAAERVYQLNLQLFPLSADPDSRKGASYEES